MVTVTLGIVQDADPKDWTRHRFGLVEERWRRLAGKAVWVTGAGTGYGRAIAVALAAADCVVFLTGRRPAKLAETIAEMKRLGVPVGTVHPLPTDITDARAVTAAAEQIGERCADLYGLVHCAALPPPTAGRWPLQEMTVDQWQRVLATNVTGAWLVARAAVAGLAAAASFRAVLLSSAAGWAFTPGFGAYNVSKAALNSLAGSFADEAAASRPDADVQINVVDPGEARTEMNQGSPISPYAVVGIVLALLSHPPSGPNGRFFHRDGRHLGFAAAAPYSRPLLP
jgi:NAD(P)-dependent dehydrogenase (short-subunit alcohol dehydrogenase family)